MGSTGHTANEERNEERGDAWTQFLTSKVDDRLEFLNETESGALRAFSGFAVNDAINARTPKGAPKFRKKNYPELYYKFDGLTTPNGHASHAVFGPTENAHAGTTFLTFSFVMMSSGE